MKSDFLLIGKVAKPHGLHGQVKVYSYASSSDSFVGGRKIYLNQGQEMKALLISEIKIQAHSLILHFQGLENRQQAEAISGYSLYLDAKDLQDLPEGEYYWYQLIGSRVYNDQGRFLGLLKEIFSTPAHDIWVIRDDKMELMLPAVQDFVISVDLPQKRIRVRDFYDPTPGNDLGNDS
jgi:16S rRNA processing protein RimM